MTDNKDDGSGKEVIKHGYVFDDNDSWEALAEGYGVAVFCRDGQTVAYGCACNLEDEEERDCLMKYFAGARYMHENNVFLVSRVNGLVVCRKEKEETAPALKISMAREWRMKRFHFAV